MYSETKQTVRGASEARSQRPVSSSVYAVFKRQNVPTDLPKY